MNETPADVVSATEHLRPQGSRVRLEDEHGDVPGWVLITLMTAGAVIHQ
jgi:hypothetical protein